MLLYYHTYVLYAIFNVLQHTLADVRDSKTYQVSKLADGNIWMTQNLAIINYELKPFDSDVASNWTLPNTTSGADLDTSYVYIDNTYGGYYSWTAATAGTGTASIISSNASSSICSRGWRLPTAGSSGDMVVLRDNYYTSSAFGNDWTQSPLNFTLAGYRYASQTSDQGTNGRYWSSTATKYANYAYSLQFDSSSVTPSSGFGKYNGFAVRCIAK